VNHFIEACRRLKVAHDLSVTQFRIVPNYKDLRHELLVHFGSEVSQEFLRDTVLPSIDRSLSESNIEYDAKRKSKRLNPPCVHVMDESWTDDASRSFIQSGYRDVQYKWRTIATEMSSLDMRHIQCTITI
jgi:hypothetical protein